MNFFNYMLRYLLVMGQVMYEENYWDQVRFNEAWMNLVGKIRDEVKND